MIIHVHARRCTLAVGHVAEAIVPRRAPDAALARGVDGRHVGEQMVRACQADGAVGRRPRVGPAAARVEGVGARVLLPAVEAVAGAPGRHLQDRAGLAANDARGGVVVLGRDVAVA